MTDFELKNLGIKMIRSLKKRFWFFCPAHNFNKLTSSSTIKVVCGIYFLMLVLELLVAGFILSKHSFNFYQGGDSPGYMLLARNLVEHGTLSFDGAAPYRPTNFRTPGYPLFLALVYLIFHSFVPAIFFGAIISAFAAPLVYLIAKEVFSEPVSFWSGILTAMEPMGLFLGVSILTEGVFTPMLLLSVYLFIRYLKTSNFRSLGFSVLFLGLAVLIRPIMFYFWPFMTFFVLYHEFKNGWSAALKKTSLVILIFFLVLGPWLARNKIETNSWQISGLQGYVFFIDHYGAVLRYLGEANTLADVQAKALALVGPDRVFTPEGSDLLFKTALEEIKKHKLAYLNIYLKSLIPFFASNGYKSLFIDILGLPARAPYIPFELFLRFDFRSISATLQDMNFLGFLIYWGGKVFWSVLSLLGLGAMVYLIFSQNWHQKQPEIIFLILVIFYFALITGPTVIGGARTRAPINGLLFIFSIFGIRLFWHYASRFFKPL